MLHKCLQTYICLLLLRSRKFWATILFLHSKVECASSCPFYVTGEALTVVFAFHSALSEAFYLISLICSYLQLYYASQAHYQVYSSASVAMQTYKLQTGVEKDCIAMRTVL